MFALPALVAAAALAPAADPPKPPREALAPLNPLVGSWKGTGYPDGTREEREKGFWSETLAVEWRFKGSDGWLTFTIEKGKHFTAGELRYLPESATFQLTLTTPAKEQVTFTGPLTVGKQKEQVLTLDRTDPAANEDQRFVLTLLHPNRFLYRLETKPAGAAAFARRFQVGATKEGEPFAEVGGGPECVVSGGQAKTPVTFKGKTYYVCCSGCRDAFNDDPEKYVKEYEAKGKK